MFSYSSLPDLEFRVYYYHFLAPITLLPYRCLSYAVDIAELRCTAMLTGIALNSWLVILSGLRWQPRIAAIWFYSIYTLSWMTISFFFSFQASNTSLSILSADIAYFSYLTGKTEDIKWDLAEVPYHINFLQKFPFFLEALKSVLSHVHKNPAPLTFSTTSFFISFFPLYLEIGIFGFTALFHQHTKKLFFCGLYKWTNWHTKLKTYLEHILPFLLQPHFSAPFLEKESLRISYAQYLLLSYFYFYLNLSIRLFPPLFLSKIPF